MTTTTQHLTPRLSFGEWLRRNPITLKEMRSRMRGRRAFVTLTINTLLLGGLVTLVYASYATTWRIGGSVRDLQSVGKLIFAATVGVQLLVTCFNSEASAVGAIVSERERQTFDLLRTTLLSARAVVLGKLWAVLLFNLLLIVAAIPVASLSFLFGGVTFEEIFIGLVMLIVSALAFSTIGLFFSSVMRRTSQATALSTVATVVLIFGIPLIMLLSQGLLGSLMYTGPNGPNTSVDAEIFRDVVLWLLISISPMSAGIGTLATLLESKNALTISFPVSNGSSLILPSPWIAYSVFYLLLSVVLITLSIRAVRRVEK